MATDKRVLLNADVLVHATDSLSRLHVPAVRVRALAAKRELDACVTGQVLNEYVSTITNPAHVNNPLEVEKALEEYEKYSQLSAIAKIAPHSLTYRTQSSLIERYGLAGAEVYTAELLAVMLDNGVRNLCTFETERFGRFSEISVLNPLEFSDSQTILALT